MFALIVLRLRRRASKEIEILVLRHELEVLGRQHPRPRQEPKDRALLALLSRLLPRDRWSVLVVRPETLLRWQRRMVRRHWSFDNTAKGRPATGRRAGEADRAPGDQQSEVGLPANQR